jgi:hypothetical protein
MAGTCQSNYASEATGNESLGPMTPNERIVDGPIGRLVKVTIPPGGLVGATSAEMILRVDPHQNPFPAVEFEIGPPFGELVVIDEADLDVSFEFDWELPQDCGRGCDLVVPLTIGYVDPDDMASFAWSMSFGIFYRGAIPKEMQPGPSRTFIVEVVDPS